jgi:tetratricopeptide (TPR) repeat protein
MYTDHDPNQEEDAAFNINELVDEFERLSKRKEIRFLEEGAWVKLADHFMLKKAFKQAMIACKNGLEQHPSSLDLHLILSDWHNDHREYAKTLQVLERAELYHPQDYDLLRSKAQTLSILGREDEALEILKNLLDDTDPESLLDVHYKIAHIYFSKGEVKPYLHHLQMAMFTDLSNEELAYELMLHITLEESLAPELETKLVALTEKDPFNKNAWFVLGVLYSHLDQKTKAEESFGFAVAIDDKFIAAWYQLGIVYMSLGNPTEAVHAFEMQLAHEKTPDALIHLAGAYENLEQYQNAIKFYKQALELEEDADDALYGIAFCLYQLEKCMEAIHFVKLAIKENPEVSDYYTLLGDCEDDLGNFQSSVEAYQEAIVLDPTNVEAWLNWSETYYIIEDYTMAINLIEEGLEELPGEADLLYRAFVYMVYAGRNADAYHYLETALQVDYSRHEAIYEFFSDLPVQKKLNKFIAAFKK